MVDNGDSVVITVTHQSLNESGALVCIDKASGTRVWTIVNASGFARTTGQTAQTLVSATLDYRLLEVDRGTGKVLSIGRFHNAANNWQGETHNVSINGDHAYINGGDSVVWRFKLRF